MQSENGITYYLVFDIRKDKSTNEEVESIKKTIEDTMNELHATGKFVTKDQGKKINVQNRK